MSPRFVAHDASLARILGSSPRLEKVVDCDAHEGPVFDVRSDVLYVTTVPTRDPCAEIRAIHLDGGRFPIEPERVSTLPTSATMPNGMTMDRDGLLVVCEQGDLANDACISRVDPSTGSRTVVADRWRGARLNSPNDVVVGADGAVWFTDPSYGHLQGFRPAPIAGDHVYRYDPASNSVEVAAIDFDKPNGIALSVDESTLYVTDSGANQTPGSFHPERPHHVVAYDVLDDGHLANRRRLATVERGIPDGLKIDAEDRIYVSAASGVLVLSPDGHLLGEINLPGAVNFAFGGRDGNVLFITADTAVWAVTLAVSLTPPTVAARAAAAPSTTGAFQ